MKTALALLALAAAVPAGVLCQTDYNVTTVSVIDTAQTIRLRKALEDAGARHYGVHLKYVKQWSCYYSDAAKRISAALDAGEPVPETLPEAVDQIPQYLAWVDNQPAAYEDLYISEMDIADQKQELQDFISETITVGYMDDTTSLKEEVKHVDDMTMAEYYKLENEYLKFQTTTTDINKNYGCGEPGEAIVNEMSMEEYMANVGLGRNTIYEARMAEREIIEVYLQESTEEKDDTDVAAANRAPGQISSNDDSGGSNKAWLAAYIAIPCVGAIGIAGALFFVLQRKKNAASAEKHTPLQA